MSTSTRYVSKVVDSTSIFKDDIFKGKVLFCTGGGSGICKSMTESVVCALCLLVNYRERALYRCDMARMQSLWEESRCSHGMSC